MAPVSSSPFNNESRTHQPIYCYQSINSIDVVPSRPFHETKKSVLQLGREWLFEGIGRLFRNKAFTASLEVCDIPQDAPAVTLEALALSFYDCDESISIWDALQTYVVVAKIPAALPKTTLVVLKNGPVLLFKDLPVSLQIAVRHAYIKIIKNIYRFKPLLRRPPPK